jgi:heme-degrading monooxygenase HmoA
MDRRQAAPMRAAGYVSLWQFEVPPAKQAEFETQYGPDGGWARLFRRASGYLGSELLKDRSEPLRYLTIDRWESADAWRAFRREHATEYERLDREFESLTAREAPLGEYAPAGGAMR